MENLFIVLGLPICLIFMILDYLDHKHYEDKDSYTEEEKMWAEIENERHIKELENERKKDRR